MDKKTIRKLKGVNLGYKSGPKKSYINYWINMAKLMAGEDVEIL